MTGLLICKECCEGKHGNCDGTAWSNELDTTAPCRCPDREHQRPTVENDAGLEARYHVEKIDDLIGKHDDCRYFVLDPQHDPIAREALRHYAVHALSYGYLALYQDLDRWLTQLDCEADGSWGCGRCGKPPESHAPRGDAGTCVYDPVFTRVPPPGAGS